MQHKTPPAFVQGSTAFDAGTLQNANPFAAGTADHDDWDHGWTEAAECAAMAAEHRKARGHD